MTRRIALAILVTVYLAILLAGGVAYAITRSVLLADLDANLLTRLASLPALERPASFATLAGSAAGPDDRDRFVIRNESGQTLARPQSAESSDVPELQILSRSFATLSDGSRERTLTVKAFLHRSDPQATLVPVTVVYTGRANRFDALLAHLAWSLGIYGLLAGLATAAVAFLVARAALRPLHATAEAIALLNENNLDQRVPLRRLPPELVPVGERLNELLARLARAFTQRKQFLADASHELRTPVAALITTLEVTLHRARSPEDYRRTLESCLADARLLQQLVTLLMTHVRSEQSSANGETPDLAPVEISTVIDHCADIAARIADKKNISIDRKVPAALVGITDEIRLRTITANLLSNAVEYTPARGKVTVSLETLAPPDHSSPACFISAGIPEGVPTEARLLRLRIADTGPGIPPELAAQIFEPFFRMDQARTESGHHLGLGLFLVRSQARTLGGDCRVESARNSHSSGSVFIVELPMLIFSTTSSDDSLSASRDFAKAAR